MTVYEYKVRFCRLAHHATYLLPTEAENICRFVMGLTYHIQQTTHQVFRGRASFQSVVEAAREVELMHRDKFGDLKRVRTAGKFQVPYLEFGVWTKSQVIFSVRVFMLLYQHPRAGRALVVLIVQGRAHCVQSRSLRAVRVIVFLQLFLISRLPLDHSLGMDLWRI